MLTLARIPTKGGQAEARREEQSGGSWNVGLDFLEGQRSEVPLSAALGTVTRASPPPNSAVRQ